MRSLRMPVLCALAALCCMALAAKADVKPVALFCDNAVLQQRMKIPVWGTGDAGEKVTVTLAGRSATTTADDKGAWRVDLAAIEAGGPFEMTLAGKNTLTLKNVMIGEVWLCSGQSNMVWNLAQVKDAADHIAKADYPNIRLFTVPRSRKTEPTTALKGAWAPCTPETAKGFSAVGYFFGREIHTNRGVAVGLIASAWGGTPVEAWTSMPVVQAEPASKRVLERWEKRLTEYPEAIKKYREKLAEWKVAAAKAKEANERAPRPPRAPLNEGASIYPGNLYNGMIHPLIPYAIRGAIWYQGESNAWDAVNYRGIFSAMITDWRKRWGQGDFPFLFVQLPEFRAAQNAPVDARWGWAELREAQMKTLSLPSTGMAITLGLGEEKNIHPKDKEPVGVRLALLAQAEAYGEKTVCSGPLYREMRREGNRIRLLFDHVGDGLASRDGGELKGFAIAGPDKKFVWAKAAIEKDTVVVWSDEIAEPAAVCYAWAANPVWSLMNKNGLPASPFRTDSK